MPDYYTSQFSGEEIDAALRAAQMISGASTPAELRNKLEIYGSNTALSPTDSTTVYTALKYRCNPNLLDNPAFQIWQRYPDGYKGVPNTHYIADRWIFLSSDGSRANTLTKATDYGGVFNDANGANLRIWQRLENAAQYNGKKLTLSMLRSDGLYYDTMVASGWTDTTDIFDLFIRHANCNKMGWIETGKTLYAAKLELGDTQTLAHKENGEWVLNEIPDYGEQLRRCQRYYWRFAPAQYVGAATAFGLGPAYARAVIPLPCTMRTSPAINTSNAGGLFLSGATGDIFNASVATVWTDPNAICVEFTKNETFSANAAYFIRGADATWIDISADL